MDISEFLIISANTLWVALVDTLFVVPFVVPFVVLFVVLFVAPFVVLFYIDDSKKGEKTNK